MSPRNFVSLSLCIFSLVGIVHALRLLYKWPFTVGTFPVPMWASWVALVIAVILVSSALKLLKKRGLQ